MKTHQNWRHSSVAKICHRISVTFMWQISFHTENFCDKFYIYKKTSSPENEPMAASPQAQHVGSLVQHLRAHDNKVGRHNGTTEIGHVRRCSHDGPLERWRGVRGEAVRGAVWVREGRWCGQAEMWRWRRGNVWSGNGARPETGQSGWWVVRWRWRGEAASREATIRQQRQWHRGLGATWPHVSNMRRWGHTRQNWHHFFIKNLKFDAEILVTKWWQI